MPRYLPVQLDAANDQVRHIYAETEADVGFVPNFVKTLAHSNNFLESVAALYRSMLGASGLNEKIRQLAILKICRLQKCGYTIHHFEKTAREAGWTDQQLEALEDYAQSDLFNFYEKDVLRLAEFVGGRPDEIPEDFWTQLDNHFTSDQVVELVTLMGFFDMVSRIALTLGIEPEPEFSPAKAG